jgi:glycosyltransferase involved in cell wall biosynthesis
VHVLFFNEGNLGTHIMGQGQLTEALRLGLAGVEDVEATFTGLSPMGRLAGALAARPVPGLGERELDLRALRWHLAQSVRARGAIERALAGREADAVFVHSHSVGMTLGRLMRRRPTVLSLDVTVGDWSQMPAWRSRRPYAETLMGPSRALERRALEHAALTIAWTDWARRSAERAAPKAQIVEHHPGLDLERYVPAPRRPRRMPRVLFVGGRFAEKGGPELIETLSGSLGESVELDVVTPFPPPARPGLRAHQLDPGDPALLDLFQQADVMCLPTYGDAAPWAVLEAMACGTPVLSTRVGGIPDLLDRGRAGLLVEPSQPRELAAALRTLLDDEQLRAALAGRARERCQERYDARRQVPALLERIRALTRR